MKAPRLTRSAVLLLAMLLGAQLGISIEKGAIAQNADLVVAGQLTGVWSFPWIDGWHFRGTLKVTRVLWGPGKAGQTLDYRFACNHCVFWPRPDLERHADRESLWFLNRASGSSWEPSFGPNGDPGFRDISDIHYFEQVLSLRKASARPR
ncbi:MAG: hypothetical protein IPP47_06145 [Bryobacterales bacterium]|nr:hypothetical protein [Bryobacterales bacterium]